MHGFERIVERPAPRYIPGDAHLRACNDFGFRFRHAERDDASAARDARNLLRHGERIGHRHVEKHDVGRQLLDVLQGVLRSGGRAD